MTSQPGEPGQAAPRATGPSPPSAQAPSKASPRAAGRAWALSEAADGLDAKRGLVPVLALAVAIIAATADPGPAHELVFLAAPVVAFAGWGYLPRRGPRFPPAAILLLCGVAVMVSAVLAQLSGGHEPAMFEVSILGLVVGRWCPPLALALPLGLLAAATPVVVYLVQDPGEVNVGIWILGIVFPWILGRANARERRLAALLDDSRRELAHQSLLDERRRIARDVHDLVGHGLAAVMLQVTSARHVLHRDPVAAEEALRSAEEVGRRSMRELRRTVTLLRTDEGAAATAPPVSAGDIAVLVDEARAGGLAVDLRMRGNLADVPAGIGVAVYRIAQEALANAARHAPRARTDMLLERAEDRVRLEATTVGPVPAASAGERDRPRYGLAGMRERATVLGGALSAGPTPDGWRVSCWLPLDADEVAARTFLLTRTAAPAGVPAPGVPAPGAASPDADGDGVPAEAADGGLVS
ncbi:sensor histidine kinase [Pseudofrankia asymbiotica]|uniref:histidine kinase n=1 Tax=Pseudofrankia asymbiotica TaxID=1834516 RepID=A0A1V2IF82_9ACTN|nr:histidine kinase [Pseudofrankia asymbiotica]ONH31126.1 hypothetical protein BL253_10755 [Pseudofrankia asymbiotica]